MFSWVWKGLRSGVVTTRYPAVAEAMPEEFRGRPLLDATRCQADQGCVACIQVCLPGALSLVDVIGDEASETRGATQQLVHDDARCIMCGLCVDACPVGALQMANDYELATTKPEDMRVIVRFTPVGNQEDEQEEQQHG